jgi:hypothetical protein
MQLLHMEVPLLPSNLPASQLEQALALEAEYMPTGHVKQLVDPVLP